MTTGELIELFRNKDVRPFQNKTIDHNVTAINLLRERIPMEVCGNIIGASEHDELFLCGLDEAAPYLSTEDVALLQECNVWVSEEYECFGLFT
jgi:hypothetical protein